MEGYSLVESPSTSAIAKRSASERPFFAKGIRSPQGHSRIVGNRNWRVVRGSRNGCGDPPLEFFTFGSGITTSLVSIDFDYVMT